MSALAGGVLVDADYSRSGHFRLGKCVYQPQDSAAADRRTDDVGQPGSGPAREGETDRRQGRAKPLGPLAVPSGQAGYLLDERPAPAISFRGATGSSVITHSAWLTQPEPEPGK